MNYTKGKWKLDGHTIYAFNRMGYNRFSCHAQTANDDDGTRISDAEMQANAKLMAAAPDMKIGIGDFLGRLLPLR